jgi:protein-S-isoprenylcysteine O-methyltransferase Ste14
MELGFLNHFRGRRNLARSQRGNVWVTGILVILGVALISVGLFFWAVHPPIWETATGYTLLGLGALTGLGVLYHHKVFWGLLSVTLATIGALVLIAHYAGYI